MIQRRRPIESAIAERKMFNMGGMAAPMQQPTYMDLMQQGIMGMPQQQMGMPQQQMGMQQPQGIMASSQPLVDAIAADANNPAGGNTLSMAQGGLASEELMARGFENGGVNQLLIRPGSREERRIEMGRAPEAFSDATVGDYSIFNSQLQDALRLRQRSLDKLKPINRAFYGEVARGLGTASDYLTVTSEEKAENDKRREAESLKSVGFNSREELNAEQQRIEMIPLDVWLQQVGATGKTREYFLNQDNLGSALSDIRIGEPDEDEATPESYEPRLPPSDFELNPTPEDLIRADANMDPNAPGDRPQGEIVPEAPGGKIVLAEGISVAAADDSDVPRPKVKPPIPQGPFDVEGEIVPGEEPPAGTGGVLDEVDAAAYTAAQNVVAKTLDTDKRADPKDIAAFKKDFMEAMPKYEGMSEEEKGFLIAEAGLRVMAGKDPNAITNIAEGLKGLGPALMKGAKEKRAWNRQVELSAAKYGLENVARDAAELRADAKADRQIFGKVFRVRKGQTFERNGEMLPEKSTVILTQGEIRNGSVDLSKLATEGSIAAGLKEYNTRLKSQLDQIQKSETDPNKFEGPSKRYLKSSAQVRTNTAVTGFLKNGLAALNTKDVLGFRGLGKDVLLRISNATGMKEYSEAAFGKLTNKADYIRFTEGATTKFIEGLISEGGKISDFERGLARELSGAIGTRLSDGVFADKSVLTGKIKSFITDLNADTDLNLRSMALSEKAWSTRYNTSDLALRKQLGSYGQMLRESRRPLSGGRTGIAKGSLNWKDIINVDADGKTLGLKKNYRSGK